MVLSSGVDRYRIRQCLWHRGAENRRCSMRVGRGWWDPLRAHSTGMPKREAIEVAACSLSSGVLVRDRNLFGR